MGNKGGLELYFREERNPGHAPRTNMDDCILIRVNLTSGNRSSLTGYRSNRSGPVPVSAGTQPAKIQNLNLNSKKMKNSQKIPKNISRCDESNGVKFSQKFVHLVWFAEFIS